VQRYDYSAYGESSGATGNSANAIDFPGQRADADNGLIDMRAHHYELIVVK
jgi:hypothetical protein